MFRLKADGIWMEEILLTASVICAVGTSGDCIHIVTNDDLGNDKYLSKTWTLVEDYVLIGQEILTVKKDVDNEECVGDFMPLNRKIDQAEFSSNGRHVAILYNKMIVLCGPNEVGEWIETSSIKEEMSIESFTFSTDSTHMIMISLMDCNGKNTFKFWYLGKSEKWVEENINSSNDDGVNSISFSEDGSNMVMGCANGKVKILGVSEGYEQWLAKDCITGSSVHMVIFSPDNRYVVSMDDGSIITVIRLNAALPILPTLLTFLKRENTGTILTSCTCLIIHILKSLVGLKDRGFVILDT
ncbi:MAG: WD40 repeat domain-containing protein [Candidatus Endonucleobacter bathymodioli]|uniref:WD40 repeat domain-containing protein n=1 Tax=Candidatus Endonucleibacter bathymodioli TaxID=539814 RepID=A0AA90SYP3_9GAMM|nr:WD40 repeat domain-containing protein [Candidatus Endonucleobacter bathymodioli]